MFANSTLMFLCTGNNGELSRLFLVGVRFAANKGNPIIAKYDVFAFMATFNIFTVSD